MSHKYVRQEDNEGAVLNTDNNRLAAYKSQKAKLIEADLLKTKVDNLEEKINRMMALLEGK